MRDVEMHEKVRIKKTGEFAFVVWFDEEEPEKDSYLLEIDGANEMPEYYDRDDFEKVEE